jgi:hypothetical protein
MGVVLGAFVSVVTTFSTAALAGTGVGGIFNLGRVNNVNASTQLVGSSKNPMLQVRNSNGLGSGIGIKVAAGQPPLVVNSSTEVPNLNVGYLGGLNSIAYQQVVMGSCSNGTAYSSINRDGTFKCSTSEVLPIDVVTSEPGYKINNYLPPSSLALNVSCADPGTFVGFFNNGGGNATLNWMFSNGGNPSPVNASGVVLAPNKYEPIYFAGGRAEGQFIYADASSVTTVNLHAYDGGTFCEVTGTAEVALTT